MPKDGNNGLICKGQTLSLDKGYSTLSLLITSLGGDKETTFKVGTREVSAKIQDSFEAIGMWDLMRSRIMAYIKPQAQALTFSHTHSKDGDMLAKQMYFFKCDIALESSTEITLPNDENILILSATLLKDDMLFKKADEHFDTMEKRKFDYVLSDYALKASQPAKFEVLLDKFIDRTYSPQINAIIAYTKLSFGDFYSHIRNIPNPILYPKRKEKMLKR